MIDQKFKDFMKKADEFAEETFSEMGAKQEVDQNIKNIFLAGAQYGYVSKIKEEGSKELIAELAKGILDNVF